MAGIGFELKKVFRDDSVFAVLRGYSLAAVVTEGPMMLMIVLLVALQRLMMGFGTPYRVREQFLFFMTYAMVFSLLLADTVLLFLDRFISDCIYRRRLQDVMPALYGVAFFLLLLGAPAAGAYLCTLPVGWNVQLAAGLLFCVLLVLWVQMACLSAVKRYEYLLLGFLAGTATALVLAWVFLRLGVAPLSAALWGTALGFLVLLFLYMGQLLACYPSGGWNLVVFFPALQRYAGLLLTGLLLGVGLYGHNFVFWASAYRGQVFPTGVYCARYDVPAFFATLTILPMLVQFVVKLETRFAVRHRAYFDAILYGGRLEDIRAAKQEMEAVLYAELSHMMQMQLIVAIGSVAFLGNFLQTVGLDETMAGTFRVLCFGYCLYGLVKCGTVLLLYFDDRAGACRAAALFAVLSVGGSLVTLALGPDTWGAGFLLAGAVTGFWVLRRLRRYLEQLEYHVFCEQPLFAAPQGGVLCRAEEELARIDRAFAQRRKPREQDRE
ncbi:exopolysaccharide Pel transporter PelG [Gemmiger formicilis]|uniref:exopolysaccharide Pel transporter PelG n=1 Tax=Gemmiger formicilis TaxID=745368 RepID=UPI00195C98E7|nr:exopolysaccharide Pel transporter PelG [Gemmiger formicilis]MBM6899164.1 exopolysaccharide Pel transporter PelG [Gemmiger formicilis]